MLLQCKIRRLVAADERKKDKLPTIIDTLITAVRNGELDGQLMQGSKQVAVKKGKAA